MKDLGKHIIIADDDRDDVELFQSAMSACKPEVSFSIASDGKGVLELLEEGPEPALILLDLNMPGMDGYECLRAIRENDRHSRIPIMILSTSTSPKDIDYCFTNGADYYVVKPGSYQALSKLVIDLCNGVMINQFVQWE